MTKFEKLMKDAQMLEAHLNTEWAEANSDLYDTFDSILNTAYDNGELTDDQFNVLATIAFYDYCDLK